MKIELTNAEAIALFRCADEGYEGLATDESCVRTILGGQRGVRAADRALRKLSTAINWKAVGYDSET